MARTRWAHPTVIPVLLFCAAALIDGGVWAIDLSPEDARSLGLIKLPPETSDFSLPWLEVLKRPVNVTVLLDQASEVAVATMVTAIAILLNVTAIEVAERTPGDLDHELRSNGIANLLVGVCGGVVCNMSLNRTQANRISGATSRLSGVVAGCLCLAGIVVGPDTVKWVPTPVIAGLLIFLGGSLIWDWGVRSWHRLSAIDNALVITIPVLAVNSGYLQAAGFGVVASCIIFAVKYSRMRVIKHDLTRREYRSRLERSTEQSAFLTQNGDLIHIMWIQGYLFFGTASRLFEQAWQRIGGSRGRSIRFLILDLSNVSGVDSSSVFSFAKLADLAQNQAITLVLAALPDAIRKAFSDARFLANHSNVIEFSQVDGALEWVEEALLGSADLDTPSEPSFRSWLDEELRRVGSADRLMRYLEAIDLDTGAELFRRGDTADSLYLVCSGRMSAMLHRPHADPVRLRSTTAFTVVGEMGLYRDQARTASVVADEPSRVYRLSKAALKRMESNEPELCSAFHAAIVRILADRLDLATIETDSLQR